MPRDRVPSIGFILSVVLAAAGGCGRMHPLSVPPGAGVEPRDGAIVGADVRTPLDGGAHDASDAAVALDAKSGPDASDASTAPPDASSDASQDAGPDGGRIPYHALAVVTGEAHTCVILDDHKVKCWGDNSFGELGYGDLRRRGQAASEMGDALPTVDLGTALSATAIAASRYTTCAILDDGSLRCWGWSGLLGQATVENIGDEPGEMGDHLPALDFGGRKPVHFAMGEYIACASMDDDTIWCWGGTAVNGPPFLVAGLPTKRVTALAPGGDGVVALYEDGSISPQLPNGTVPVLTSDHKALAVAGSNGADTCALLDDGTTICAEGTEIRASGPANAIAIGVERVGGLCSVLSNGSVQCHERNCIQPTYYQCSSDGSFALGAPAVAVTSNGTDFACALLAGGDVKCWGANLTMPPAAWLGAAIDFTETSDGGITYGAWHAVDLGTHP